MTSRICRRRSLAIVLALIALAVLVNGASYGLATDHTGNRQIKDSSVQGNDTQNRSLSAEAIGPGKESRELSSDAYGRYKDGPVFTSDGPSSVLSLSLPAGNWVIIAKAIAYVGAVEYECRLVAGDDFDRVRLSNGGPSFEAITPTVLHSAATDFTVHLQCSDNDPSRSYQLTDMKIHAMRVGSLTNSPG